MSTDVALDPRRTALLIQDLQKDVVADGGAFSGSGSPEHAREQDVVNNAKRLAEVCRRAGVPVIHLWFVVEPGARELPLNAPIFQGIKDGSAFVRGTWGAEPAEGLEPADGDFVVEKRRMSGWQDTQLEAILRGLDVDTIIVTGAWTNMSVEHTARTGADKGYRVLLPEDACSSMNADWHQVALTHALPNVATVTSSSSIAVALAEA